MGVTLKIKGWDLDFFNSGEWQVCDERLTEIVRKNKRISASGFNPGRKNLFASLRATPEGETRVAIIGQDPYPNGTYSTGLAFSIPRDIPRVSGWPPALEGLLSEYSSDLGYDFPHSGDLSSWAAQGVLLWDSIPTSGTTKSLSHDWPEYEYLTREILRKLSERGIVFAFLGGTARRFVADAAGLNNAVIETSYPSPRGTMNSKNPFRGSRLFSTINAKLVDLGLEKIDWKL